MEGAAAGRRPDRFVFVINPVAGRGGFADRLEAKIRAAAGAAACPAEIYRTAAPGEGWRFVQDYPREAGLVCFVACGGDGTLHEVINGAMARGNAVAAVIPCGSGNDFVRAYPERAFGDVAALFRGTVARIDLLHCAGRYTVNLCNVGFDARVAMHMQKFKRLPLIGGSMAYQLAIFYALLGGLSQRYTLAIDGESPMELPLTLAAACNGGCYGGGYQPAPDARVDDGIIDFCGVRRLSLPRLCSLLGRYKRGEHVRDPNLRRYLILSRCKRIAIRSDRPMVVCMDGEIFHRQALEIRVEPSSLPFLLPALPTV